MKKLIIAVLALALLLPVSALAVTESDVVGCWANYDVLTTGAPSMTMIYFAADHTCYYLIQSYHTDKAGIGRTYVGQWELQGDGTIWAKTGNNTETTLTVYQGGSVALNQNLAVFVNITPFTLK